MKIKKIKLYGFRNYNKQEINFDDNINIFYGDNAQGKTNVLEAIFLTAMGKSFRAKKERELINLEKDYSIIEIEYEKKDRNGKIKIEIKDKKVIYVNGIKINKLSEVLGNINIVMFSPDDINILKNGPANRRKFLNMMISQLRPAYVYNLNLYLKTLEQRNNYLKQIKLENKNKEFIEIWDEKLAEYGEKVFLYRQEFVNKLKEKITGYHKQITEDKEEIKISYISDFSEKEKYLKYLKDNLKEDIERGYTKKGIHRDDIYVYINKKLVNIYGSQGQHRTAILSLKLSELEIVYEEIGEYPVLLLDDFMSELDKKRIHNFLENIENTQVIITCTDKLKDINGKIFRVENGQVFIDNNDKK